LKYLTKIFTKNNFLTNFELDGCNINDKGLFLLLDQLTLNKHLKSLNIFANEIYKIGKDYILFHFLFYNHNIEFIDIERNIFNKNESLYLQKRLNYNLNINSMYCYIFFTFYDINFNFDFFNKNYF
jgi:Ran GTPase-activating protein (RanGAP) involved in mRNA processing and transport